MPPPTKFTSRRREQVLQILRAGGSRPEAAKAAGVDKATLWRWLERGRRSKVPDGTWSRFRNAVLEAEGEPPELQALRDRFELAMRDGESALAFLDQLEQRDEQADVPQGPVVTVTFAPTTAKGDE